SIIARVAEYRRTLEIREILLIELRGTAGSRQQILHRQVVTLILVNHGEIPHRRARLTVLACRQRWDDELATGDGRIGGCEESRGIAVGELAEDHAAAAID